MPPTFTTKRRCIPPLLDCRGGGGLVGRGANPNQKTTTARRHYTLRRHGRIKQQASLEYLFIEPLVFGQAAEFLIRCVPSGTHGLVKLEKRKVELQRSSDLINWHTIMVKDNLQSIAHLKILLHLTKTPDCFIEHGIHCDIFVTFLK